MYVGTLQVAENLLAEALKTVIIQSRDILFMEEKTTVDWEIKKKGTSSESTNNDRLDIAWIHLVVNRMLAESTEGEPDTGSGQGSESDSDEQLT